MTLTTYQTWTWTRHISPSRHCQWELFSETSQTPGLSCSVQIFLQWPRGTVAGSEVQNLCDQCYWKERFLLHVVNSFKQYPTQQGPWERKKGGGVLSKHFPGGPRLSSFKSLLYFKPKYVMNFSFPVTEMTQKSTPYTIERTFNPIHLIRSEIRGTRSLTLGRDYECATETSYNTYWNVPNSAKKSFWNESMILASIAEVVE